MNDSEKYFTNIKPIEPICKFVYNFLKIVTDNNKGDLLNINDNPFTDFYQKFYYNNLCIENNDIYKFKNPTCNSISKGLFEKIVKLKHKNKHFLNISEKIISDIFRKYSNGNDYCNHYMYNNISNFEVIEPTESKLGGVKYYYDYRGMWWEHLLRPRAGYIEIYLNANNNYDIFIYYLVGYEKGYKLKKALNNIPQRLVHLKLNGVFVCYSPSYLKELKMEKERKLKLQHNAMKKAEKDFKENKTKNDNPYKNDIQKFFWEYKFRELKVNHENLYHIRFRPCT